jgi:mono/diheme cytochrome c family protein
MQIPSFAQWSRSFHVVRLGAAVGACGLLVLTLSAQTAPRQTPPARGAVPADVARGEYLVNSVAMCVQCHSPRDQRGRIIDNERLTGAPMPVRGPGWGPEWAYRAPALAGLPGFTDEQIVMLLTEGHAGDRPAPMRPMPPFRMNRPDAEAVTAYLRSLPGR